MRARVFGGLGAVVTLLAVVVLLRPDVVDALPGFVAVVESQDPKRLLLALGAAVGSYAAWTARAGSPDRPPTEGPAARFARVGDPPESVSAADRTRTGESFDERVDVACSGDDEALEEIRAILADAAARTHARAADCTPAQAQQAVETGAWTDDRLAGAFLAGDDGPGFPLLARLQAWLDRSAERRRRIERTVRVIKRSMDDVEGGVR